MLTLGCEPI